MLKKREWLIVCSALLICLIPIKVFAFAENHHLYTQLEQILKKEPDLNGAIIGVSIRSGGTGRIIFQHQGDIRLRPASNLKLLTAASALSVLGINHTYRTEVLTNGKMKGTTLKGDLYIKGKGDPTLLKSDINQLAEDLRQARIRKIDGNLTGDDTWYDNIRYSIDLPWSDESAYYGAQISALTVSPNKDFDQGTVIVEVIPGKLAGMKARVKVTPQNNYIKVKNKAITVSKDKKQNIQIKREHAKNTIIIEGETPVKGKKIKEWIAVWDPTSYALELLNQSLREKGIKVKGKIKKGISPQNARILTIHDSLPLSERLVPFMKLSNNGHGEMLIKEIGKARYGKGSWEQGLEALKNELIKFGVNPDEMNLRDGSGISHVNLIQANQITQLLFAVQDEKWFPVFLNSLPQAGGKDRMICGTLRNRLVNIEGTVKAKTGTLATVSSLSGYVKTKSGQNLIFSILINNLLDESKGKRIEDKIVAILANQ